MNVYKQSSYKVYIIDFTISFITQITNSFSKEFYLNLYFKFRTHKKTIFNMTIKIFIHVCVKRKTLLNLNRYSFIKSFKYQVVNQL